MLLLLFCNIAIRTLLRVYGVYYRYNGTIIRTDCCTTVTRDNSYVVEDDSCHEACVNHIYSAVWCLRVKQGQCRAKTLSSRRDVRVASLTAGINRTRGNKAQVAFVLPTVQICARYYCCCTRITYYHDSVECTPVATVQGLHLLTDIYYEYTCSQVSAMWHRRLSVSEHLQTPTIAPPTRCPASSREQRLSWRAKGWGLSRLSVKYGKAKILRLPTEGKQYLVLVHVLIVQSHHDNFAFTNPDGNFQHLRGTCVHAFIFLDRPLNARPLAVLWQHIIIVSDTSSTVVQ